VAPSLQVVQLKPDPKHKASFTILLDKLPHFRVGVGNEFLQVVQLKPDPKHKQASPSYWINCHILE
jgi:hypothetical protein